MSLYFAAAALGLLVAMGIAITRALLGPTLYDRVLAGNMFGTKTVLMISVFGFLTDRPAFLDLALIYAFMNFIAILAIMKYFRYRDLGQVSQVREGSE